MDRRSFLKRAGAALVAAAAPLYIPAERLDFGVPKQLAVPLDVPESGVALPPPVAAPDEAVSSGANAGWQVGMFDGRYVYFTPYGSNVVTFDTRGSFTDPTSYDMKPWTPELEAEMQRAYAESARRQAEDERRQIAEYGQTDADYFRNWTDRELAEATGKIWYGR